MTQRMPYPTVGRKKVRGTQINIPFNTDSLPSDNGENCITLKKKKPFDKFRLMFYILKSVNVLILSIWAEFFLFIEGLVHPHLTCRNMPLWVQFACRYFY